MNPARIAFRVDASLRMGTGHVMRCLTLAELLRARGAAVSFVCRDHPGHLAALLAARGYAVRRLPAPGADAAQQAGPPDHAGWLGAGWQDDAAQTAAALDGRADWLVLDHYALDWRWQQALRPAAARLMVIDDLADRRHDCDLLLDQNLTEQGAARYGALVPHGCRVLAGPRYALLQPEYAQLHAAARPRSGPVRRLLVFFGGVDRDGLTLRAMQAIADLALPHLQADVVVGASNAAGAQIAALAARHPALQLHHALPSLAPLMARADLALGAGGATSWERLCLGLPSLVVTVAQNQREVTRLLARRGLVDWLGDADQAGVPQLRAALQRWCAHGVPAHWYPGFGDIDGAGCARVADLLLAPH